MMPSYQKSDPAAIIVGPYVNVRITVRRNGENIMVLDKIALVLSIIGAVNWGLVGLFKFDVISFLFGSATGSASRVVYTIVGIAGIWCISLLFREGERVRD